MLFLREKISLKFVMGLFMSFFGILLIALQDLNGASFNFGILLVLGAAFLNAVFFIFQKPLLKKYHPNEVIFYAILVATLVLIPFGRGDRIIDFKGETTLILLLIGMATVLAHLCWTRVLRTLRPPARQ